MTAVEWLVEKLKEYKHLSYNEQSWIFEQAKAMEKEQIENSYESGIEEGINRYSSEEYNLEYYETSEQYYNETFKSE
jgi:hypothetical protein